MKIVSWNEAMAAAASFLAVVPPQPLVEDIQQYQRVYGIDTTVLPHITVKSQPGLEDPQRWRGPVGEALADLPAFDVQLGPAAWFGSEYLYLGVQGTMSKVHGRILAALASAGVDERFEYDGEGFLPHLTLGAAWAGADRVQLEHLARAFQDVRWPPFTVAEVLEFRRSAPGERYSVVGGFPLRAAAPWADTGEPRIT